MTRWLIPGVDSETYLPPQKTVDALRAEISAGDPVSLQAHIDSPTPHPAYDDIQDPILLFENGMA